jgi:hypothetical protein
MTDTHTTNGAAPESETDTEGETPFERFERLTKQLLRVPKAEVDKQLNGAKSKPRSRAT